MSAKLLPEGVIRARLYGNIAESSHWYGDHRERQPLGQVGLDQLAAKGIPAGVTNGYRITNEASYRLHRTDLVVDYGLSSDFNVGLWWPYFHHDTQESTTVTQGTGWASLSGVQRAGITGAVTTLDNTDPEHTGWGDLYLGVKQRVLGKN
ncbi:MAG: hypothetical protein HQL73_12255, partial [Magnetococcales bacterium]|nr:hypothetical protein [Magnetococcales bacterium]